MIQRPAPPILFLLLALGAALGCGPAEERTSAVAPAPPEPAAPVFVGGAVCAECHPNETERWRGSHHDRAMETPDAVLAPFAGESFEKDGETTTFFRREGRPAVRVRSADGDERDLEVAWTFGFDPLQQILVPTEGGRLQALDVAWDARPAAAGGGRWFSLHPDEVVPPGDVLHWTARSHTWNSACAECHSTDLRKGFLPDEARYDTTFEEPDVSCEACHGPGSAHVEAARAGGSGGLVAALENDGEWTRPPGASIAQRSAPPPARRREVDTCARCHARRSTILEPYAHGLPFLDTHRPALLDDDLYFADGRMREEVYVWGSFLQSAMYAAGVTCSDCHDPHALSIPDPDAACARCHDPEVFASRSHHHHPPASEAARCVSCHMPATVYMGIDARRDHSLRVPRPDVAARAGAPDPCSACHGDRGAAWAAETLERWGGPRSAESHWGDVLHAGRQGLPEARNALLELAGEPAQPGIVRATALRLLVRGADPRSPAALVRAAADAEPLLRLAAAEASRALPPHERLAVARPLLADPLRAVRIEAARALAATPARIWPPGARAAVAAPLREWREAQAVSADAPESHVNLGGLHAELGELAEARREYERALEIEPLFEPARVNLADLARREERDDLAEEILREGLERAPQSAALRHSLGLTLVRLGRLPEALDELGRAAALDPGTSRYAYAWGLALHESGEPARALEALEAAHERHPGDPALLEALASLHARAGNPEEAARYTTRLEALRGGDPTRR